MIPTPIPTGALVMLATFGIVSVVTHWCLRKYLLAVLCAVVASPIAFLAVCTIQGGLPSPLSLRSVVELAVVALPFAILVGLPFVGYRRFSAAARA